MNLSGRARAVPGEVSKTGFQNQNFVEIPNFWQIFSRVGAPEPSGFATEPVWDVDKFSIESANNEWMNTVYARKLRRWNNERQSSWAGTKQENRYNHQGICF